MTLLADLPDFVNPAVIVSMLIMMLFSGSISRFINKHSSHQVPALAFLIINVVMSITEGWHQHFDKFYIYSAIAVILIIELIDMGLLKNGESVKPNNKRL